MGKISKGAKCDIEGCSNPAERSLDASYVPEVKKKGRVYLCRNHYRDVKKHLKKEKKLERLRWV